MILLLLTINVCLMMVLIHICNQLPEHSLPLIFLLCSPNIRIKIEFMVKSDSYGNFLIVCFPIHYPFRILVGLTWYNLIIV